LRYTRDLSLRLNCSSGLDAGYPPALRASFQLSLRGQVLAADPPFEADRAISITRARNQHHCFFISQYLNFEYLRKNCVFDTFCVFSGAVGRSVLWKKSVAST
jgi:hypothetical protein